jgi:uncharacterized membrane protein
MEVVVVWLFFAGLVAWLASSRGRNGGGWFLVAAVLSPLLGLIAVLVLPNLADLEEKERAKREEEWKRSAESERKHERQLEELRALQAAVSKPGAPVSVADEIQKLLLLKESGALTDAEFDEQKSRLLRQ